MACCVVTGGAGFIGSNLVKHLVKTGQDVRVIDDLSSGNMDNLVSVMSDIHFSQGSICDASLMDELFSGAELVFHQAALASVQQSVENPQAANKTNVGGTLQVLESAVNSSVDRVVYASSSAVYGDGPTLPKTESMVLNPRSPYATSKRAGELYCQNYTDLFGLETVSLRYFNVFGPCQNPHSQYAAVIPIFITNLLNRQRPTIFGDGKQTRDFTYVDDVIEANMCAARSPNAAGQVFNVGCGTQHTLNGLLRVLADIIDTDISPEYVEERPGDVRHSAADITSANDVLDFTPSVPLREGLERTVQYYQKQHQTHPTT